MARLIAPSFLLLVACSTPVETTPTEPVVHAKSQSRLYVVRAAVANDEVAAVWAKEEGPLTLSRFSLTPGAPPQGQRRGRDEVLAPNANLATLATDGARYAACWATRPSNFDENTMIACATVPVGGGAITTLPPFAGVAPALTRGPRGLVLAFGTVDSRPSSSTGFRVHLRELEGSGASWTSEPIEGVDGRGAAIQVVSTPSGFFVASLYGSNGFRVVHTLTAGTGPFPIGDSFGTQPGTENMVAIGDTVAIGRAIPYAHEYTVVDASNRVTTSLYVGGGVKLGQSAFLWEEAGSFRAAWQKSFEGDALRVRTLPLDAGRVQDVGEDIEERRTEQYGSRMTIVASPAGALLVKDGAAGLEVVALPSAP